MTEREYLVAVYAFDAFGPTRTLVLIEYFGSAKRIWLAPKSKLLEVGLKEKVVDKFIKHKRDFEENNYYHKLKKASISYTTYQDADYPSNLTDLKNAPLVLYYRGNIKGIENAVAIVGSRNITSYGREVTSQFASELANLGVVIISGLALGNDAAAHKACLDVDGRGVAVLASGLDIISPLTNKWIALELIKEGGAVVSEYPLGYPPHRSNFPNRNRIISGLSKAIVVVEGKEKSGTLYTTSAAAEQGKTVFAIPGQITSPMSGAPHFLLKNGCLMATSVKDILTELDLQLKVDKTKVETILPTGDDEAKLLKILEAEPLHLDEAARISGLTPSEVSAKLITLELKGFVKSVGGGVYKKNK